MSGRRGRRWRFGEGGFAVVLALLVLTGLAVGVTALTDRHQAADEPGSRRIRHQENETATSPGSPAGAGAPGASATPSPIPGYLLIADAGNHRMLLVDSRKRVLWRYPSGKATPSFPLGYDDDAFFSPDHSVIVTNQEHQHTVEMISFPQGRVLWHYGHVNVPGSGAGYLDTPDDAYLLPDGTLSVADIRNCRVIFLSSRGRIVRQLGRTGVCAHDPPRTFASPNGDTPLPDGGTLVTEIGGSWIDDIGPRGDLRWSVRAPVAYPSDAQLLPDGTILVADYSSPGHVVQMDRRGRVLWRYGPPSGPGALNHPSLAIQLPNGLIAVNDDLNHRVVLISRSRQAIVWQFGRLGVPGTTDGYLDIPDGMDFLPFDVAMQVPEIRSLVTGRRP